MNPIVYVVINGELKMSAGKAAAQAVHAAAMLKGINTKFGKHVERTVIVLEAHNAQQILALHRYLNDAKVPNNYYIDEGHNEVLPFSITALAVGPIAADDPAREALRMFHLYPRKRGLFR